VLKKNFWQEFEENKMFTTENNSGYSQKQVDKFNSEITKRLKKRRIILEKRGLNEIQIEDDLAQEEKAICDEIAGR